ncbi:G-type lectin S-receptor-like serine/threonine-protein kinase At4g27290 isoform X2 [Bidens hawaiensis]|uniref:G-type lectin S-receptor-like serine/threonine-protein kinase At4g27290 isoform X2 n=1 Tax=Bidens hawaiensis TaxID=980011 RepID=UPI00404BA02D
MEGAAILLGCLLFVYKSTAVELDTISDKSFLTDRDTLVLPAGIFELGFFNPGRSDNRYLGIWFKNISVRTVVWVANRHHPLPGASPLVLKIDDLGNLGLFNNSSLIWSSNTTTSGNATAMLRDNGNLVVSDQDMTFIWQSFDYPTDTLLPGMKLGRDYLRNKEWQLSSWKSSQDPAPGEFTYGADTLGYPENKLKQGALVKFRDRPWSNQFSGTLEPFTYDVIINEYEVSLTYNLQSLNLLSRTTLNSSGQLESWVENGNGGWRPFLSSVSGACDKYNICNAYGTCNINMNQQFCTCLDEKRFVPKNQKDWDIADWSGGCIWRTPLECKKGSEGFIKYANVKLPDTENTWFNMRMTLEECATKCLENCTCMAYANPDDSRSICVHWFSDILDNQVLPEFGGGSYIFVRMASSELDFEKQEGENDKIKIIVILGVLFMCLSITTWWCVTPKKWDHAKPTGKLLVASKSQEEDMEQKLFRFSTIVNATANFSPNNKLGEGGFGPVYKGMLEDGQEVAVKRLSKNSSQGHAEFKNEVICISKLQHRNLVKILGCCIEGDEKLLIYEYMPNKSLDSFIFDKTQSVLLDWTMRFNIIKGIARGLVYMHQDSRLRIIHRDLKAGNILLDHDMNPKISDFGLARSFGGNETQANTERVVGTYGYMSPEYALDGLFSIKSDVFSFGVLVLEIVSGKRNRGFVRSDNEPNFLEHVWSLYNEGSSMDLIDSSCVESCHSAEVIRSIKVGLLCVQHNAGDRPNMSSVTLMLGGEGELPQPKQPSFFMESQVHVANFSSVMYTEGFLNDCTIIDLDARLKT